jgi:hypothetical protein
MPKTISFNCRFSRRLVEWKPKVITHEITTHLEEFPLRISRLSIDPSSCMILFHTKNEEVPRTCTNNNINWNMVLLPHPYNQSTYSLGHGKAPKTEKLPSGWATPNTCVWMNNHANLGWDAMVGKVSAAVCYVWGSG